MVEDDDGVVCDRNLLGPASIMLSPRFGVDMLRGLGVEEVLGVTYCSPEFVEPVIAIPMLVTAMDDDDDDSPIKRFASRLEDRRVAAGEGNGEVAREDSCETGRTGISGKGRTIG